MKPILFNTAMVTAILEGRKTETRRVVKQQPPIGYQKNGVILESIMRNRRGLFRWECPLTGLEHLALPRYKAGDLVYVKETFWQHGHFVDTVERTKSGKVKQMFLAHEGYPTLYEEPSGGSCKRCKIKVFDKVPAFWAGENMERVWDLCAWCAGNR